MLYLSRHRDAEWAVVLTYEHQPPSTELVEQLRSDIAAVATSIGLVVDDVWLNPTLNPGPES
jgi:hypothetical protein